MPFQRHAAEMVATHSQQSAIVYIGVGMGILSMVTTFLAFLTYLAILNYDRYLVNRLSFRLTALVCAVDFIYSFFQGLGHSRIVGTGAACRFFGWGYTNFGLISVIVRSTMAFNLMQLVIFRRASFARHERLFWLGTISFALAASLVPLCAGALGLSVPSGDCWYRRETEEGGQAWKWTTYYGWVLLCIIYSTISVVVIAITVRRRINRPELVPATSSSHFNPLHRLSHLSIYSITSVLRRLSLRHTRRHGGWDDRGEGSTSDAVLAPPNSPVAANSELSRAINATHNRPTNVLYKLILRVMWYPLIPAICQTLDVIENIVGLTTRRIYMPLYIISLVLVGMQGFLTAFVFFTDPVIVHAWTLFKCDLVVVFFFDYEWGMFRAANDWRIPPSQRNQSSVSRPSGSHSSTSNQPPFRRAGQMASDRVEVHHHRRSLFDDGFSLKHRKMLSYPFTLPPQRRAVGARLVPAPTRVTTSPNSRSRFATLPSLRHIHNVSDPLPRDSSRPHHPVAYPHLYRQSGRAWDPANPCYSHASSGSADQQSVLGFTPCKVAEKQYSLGFYGVPFADFPTGKHRTFAKDRI
ncbi:hypothetical protein IWQ60_003916 [Tieghemiomyces parasiticus]|uniref:G-protein coupled receptors family 2 profile 2 domain-containing protein n=1 Tax=Tieghemiomyces parasiticus TaxID=78921 RepID=A0A9W8DZT7_9FUNG|nr:hypothetical protein IWQ60_003916 [Tieghemiomyces parasiticus]